MAGFIIMFFFLYLLLIGGLITLYVFYLKNLQDTLKEVAPHNLQMPAVNVWLMFIPGFNLVYGFIMYPKIAESIRREFEERGAPQIGDYGKGLGLTLPILRVSMVVPILNFLAAIGILVVWIIYWVKMAELKKILRMTPAVSGVATGVKFTTNNDLLD